MRHIRRVLGVFVFALLAGCGAPEAARPASTLPGPGPSLVFGEAHAPEGGRLVVGFLVPSPPPERLVDLVSEEDLAAFHAAEAARDAGDPADEDEWVEELEEVPEDEEVWPFGEGWNFSSKQQAYRQQVARQVEAKTGVHVAFRDLLAAEIRDEAIVVVPRRSLGELFADEVPLLQAYVARGGRLLRDDLEVLDVGRSCPGILPESKAAVRVLTNVCLDAIRTSPLVHRLPHDPLEVLAAERHGDEVRVRLRAEPTEAILRDFDAQDVARIEDRSGGKIAFDCPDPGLDPFEHFLVATWRRGDLAWTRTWRVVDLVGTAERHLIASRTAEAGCSFAPRVLFLNSKTGAPVAGREDTLLLVDGDRIVATATGVSNAEGTLEASLPIPADRAPGYLQLLVGKKRFPVYVRSGLRLSVVTDRGVYRPDDEIHVRVMVHDVARGRPVSDAEVTLTLAKEEKVVRTSEHGIASATFRVEGGRLGQRKLEAKARGIAAESTFVIRAFETPSFLVDVDAKRFELRVGETMPVALVARHLNGTPLAGAKVWATEPGVPEARCPRGDGRRRAIRLPAHPPGARALVRSDAVRAGRRRAGGRGDRPGRARRRRRRASRDRRGRGRDDEAEADGPPLAPDQPHGAHRGRADHDRPARTGRTRLDRRRARWVGAARPLRHPRRRGRAPRARARRRTRRSARGPRLAVPQRPTVRRSLPRSW